MLRSLLLVLLAAGLAFSAASAPRPDPFQLNDGDRVVFLGDALVEREQSYGYVEFLLTTEFPDRKVTFRNLGWSGDTPLGVSRAGFDSPDKGFDRVKEQVAPIKPTLAFLGYGMASSFDGEAGVAKFTNDLEKLMDAVQEVSGEGKVRFVLMSPLAHEKLPSPLPDPARHNEQLALYANAVKDLAQKKQAQFVSLFTMLNETN